MATLSQPAAAVLRDASTVRAVSLLEADPQLARHIPPSELAGAQRAARVPMVNIPPGSFSDEVLRVGSQPFGALILSGLVTRETSTMGHPTLRLLGPGDLIHERVRGSDLDLDLPRESWTAAGPVTIGVLDDHLLVAVRHWPWLTRALLERASINHDMTLAQAALAQLPRADERIIALFRMLVRRWGRPDGAGMTVPIALTHEALGRLSGARRPTVSLAVARLARERRLLRQDDGGWLLLDVHDGPQRM